MNTAQSFGQIERDIKDFIGQKTKEIEQKAKQQVASKIPLMQNEIYAQYSTFIPKYISNYFASIYGATNYDEQSLIDSLALKKNGFTPDFSYDSKKFKWNKDLRADVNNFNENGADIGYVLNPIDEPDNIDFQETIDYDDGIQGYEDYSSHNSKQQFSYYNKMNRQGAFLNLDEAYKKAYAEANKNFDKKMYTEIIPKLYQKYGIKLN